MSEFGEGSLSLKIEPEKIEDKTVERIKVRLSVFFDGTLNNRTNTELLKKLREQAKQEGKKPEDKELYKFAKAGSSYQNDYTNVAKMERYIETSSDKIYQKKMAIYVEGPGTDDKEKDRAFGYAMGVGKTGISQKVRTGIEKGVNKILKNRGSKNITIIERLTLDVFGFSRGAAAARYFIHQARLSDLKISNQLEEKDCEVLAVDVNFAGLYDTVSSHGIVYSNDVSELKLHAVSHAETVVHLASADEHRERFSLTTINSAGKNGTEIFLPGVHSDIGGSYNNGEVETQLIYNDYDIEEATNDMNNLIDAGWFKPEQIELIYEEDYDDNMFSTAQLKVNRTIKYNHYSRIPLHIMAKYARESGIEIKPKLEKKEKIPAALASVYNKVMKYVSSVKKSKASDWHHNEPWLCELRNQYLHFSAKCELGLWPRFSNGKRVRQYYVG